MPEPGAAPGELTMFKAWLGLRAGAVGATLLLILLIASVCVVV